MTCVRATGSVPMTAASASLGFMPVPGLRGALGAAAFLTPGTFLATTFFTAVVLPATVFPATFLAATFFAAGAPAFANVLRGGNLLVRGSNSNATLASSLFQLKNALNARRVRMLTNLSSRSVLPVASNFSTCSRSTGC